MTGLTFLTETPAAGGSSLPEWPFGVGVGGIFLAVVFWILRPTLEAYLRERADRETARLKRESERDQEGREGWKAAVATQQGRVEAVERELKSLRARVTELEADLTAERQTNSRLSALLDHANDRVTELEAAWPTDRTMPRPRRPID